MYSNPIYYGTSNSKEWLYDSSLRNEIIRKASEAYICQKWHKLYKLYASYGKFGNVVSIFDGNDELTHSCTFIAGNLVLTKNGRGNLMPFVITYLDKTVPLYGEKTVSYERTVGDTHSVNLD